MSTKRKAPAKVAAPVVKTSAQAPIKSQIDESRAAVSAADGYQTAHPEAVELSSDSESDDVSDDEAEPETKSLKPAQRNGQLPTPAQEADDEPDEDTSPSFGELLRGNDAIDVPALLRQSSTADAIAPATRAVVPGLSGQSLATSLMQALRTDDTDMLETCLHTTDLAVIRNTVERLDTSLAGTLLGKLAARMYRRPGRVGNLMTWVQWVLTVHGGVLASQPQVLQDLGALQKVLSERAKGLNSLLVLKGKLDMLEGQMKLRRSMEWKSGRQFIDDDDVNDDEHVVWVEGDDEGGKVNGRGPRPDDDEDNAVPLTNGFAGDSDDEEDDEEDDESVAGDESLDEDDVIHEDVDDSEEDESEAEALPPSKMRKTRGSRR